MILVAVAADDDVRSVRRAGILPRPAV